MPGITPPTEIAPVSRFTDAIRLYEAMGASRIGGERFTLRDALRLGSTVSLWDVLATFLVLYRLPLVCAGDAGLLETVRSGLRPYLGRIARIRENFAKSSGTNDRSACAAWPRTGKPVIVFLGFATGNYRGVLLPVVELLAGRGDVDLVSLGNSPVPTDGMQSIHGHWTDEVDARVRDLEQRVSAVRSLVLRRQQVEAFLRDARCERGDARILQHELEWLFAREIPRLLPQLAIAEHIVRSHPVDLIVSPDAMPALSPAGEGERNRYDRRSAGIDPFRLSGVALFRRAQNRVHG
jgi:hypothetical protein